MSSRALSADATSNLAWDAYSHLALTATRLFFQPAHYVMVKALLSAPRERFADGLHPVLQLDEALGPRLRLEQKFTRKLLATLELDRLVVRYTPKVSLANPLAHVNSAANAAPAPMNADEVPVFWGLDFDSMTDAILWKLDAMERRLKEGGKSNDLQTFVCPSCGTRISSLEIDYGALLNPMTGGLACPTRAMGCVGAELAEEDNSQADAIVDAHRTALRTHLAPLQSALRNVSGMVAPTYKKPHPPEEGAGSSAAGGAGGAGGKGPGGASGGAGGSAAGGSSGGSAVTLGASMGIAKAVGSGNAAAAVQPMWMLSEADRVTAKEKEEADAAAAAAAGAAEAADASESVKWEAEYLKLFEESEQEGANAPAPPPPSLPPPPAPVKMEATAPVKTEDAAAGQKRARDDDDDDGRAAAAATTATAAAATGGDDEFDEDPIVHVGGVPKPLSQVTEDDEENMNDAEYDHYFKLSQGS